MIKFKDLGIKNEVNHFYGDKIKINKIVNKEIIVLDYKIQQSKFEGEYLQMQIKVNEVTNVIFTGSTVLIKTIQQIDKSKFPFITTITRDSEHYEFT